MPILLAAFGCTEGADSSPVALRVFCVSVDAGRRAEVHELTQGAPPGDRRTQCQPGAALTFAASNLSGGPVTAQVWLGDQSASWEVPAGAVDAPAEVALEAGSTRPFRLHYRLADPSGVGSSGQVWVAR